LKLVGHEQVRRSTLPLRRRTPPCARTIWRKPFPWTT